MVLVLRNKATTERVSSGHCRPGRPVKHCGNCRQKSTRMVRFSNPSGKLHLFPRHCFFVVRSQSIVWRCSSHTLTHARTNTIFLAAQASLSKSPPSLAGAYRQSYVPGEVKQPLLLPSLHTHHPHTTECVSGCRLYSSTPQLRQCAMMHHAAGIVVSTTHVVCSG
jgi:hypothetical protein